MYTRHASIIILTTLLACPVSARADEKADTSASNTKHPIYSQTMKSLTGKKIDLKQYRGKVLLIVNVASQCGATPQYRPLQQLHEKYSRSGLVVLGFPCNQFGAQEPGTEQEIARFCQQNYGVKFTIFRKIDVNGDKAPALYRFLTGKQSGLQGQAASKVNWNFEKFLVSRNGRVAGRFRTGVEPDSPALLRAIQKELAQPAGKTP